MKILSLAKLGIIWEVSEMISLELLKNGKKIFNILLVTLTKGEEEDY